MSVFDTDRVLPATEGDPEALVAFLDVLGTSAMVRDGQFGRITAYDFVNAAGLAARFLPSIRVAAFSDSVVISANVHAARDFLAALAFVHRNWFSDAILVRGGISFGEIDWVHDEPALESIFTSVPNFLYARVYGRALVDAHRLEQRSGPGALCTLSHRAALVLSEVDPAAVLDGPSRYLVWSDPRGVGWFTSFFRHGLRDTSPDSEASRHIHATAWYFEQLYARRQSLPAEFPDFQPGSSEWIDLSLDNA
jgi:hypothetical protein